MNETARLIQRCGWCGTDPLYVKYHDEEWGVPAYDDRSLFEFIVLESAQAGLSWITILRKRENYRRAFCDFDVEKVAQLRPEDVERLLLDSGIIRNRAKIESTISNAQAFIRIQDEFGSFARYIWSFVGGAPVVGKRKSLKDIPPLTPTAEALAKDLKKRGFKFLGPTVIYAHMQATGMVNDHVESCFRYAELMKASAKTSRHILFG